MKSVHSHRYKIVLLNCIALIGSGDAIEHPRARNFYWQASQPGSSIAQNLMSVAGVAFICACAAAAAASSALMALGAVVVLDATEFILPAVTVDFSACVALCVRR